MRLGRLRRTLRGMNDYRYRYLTRIFHHGLPYSRSRTRLRICILLLPYVLALALARRTTQRIINLIAVFITPIHPARINGFPPSFNIVSIVFCPSSVSVLTRCVVATIQLLSLLWRPTESPRTTCSYSLCRPERHRH